MSISSAMLNKTATVYSKSRSTVNEFGEKEFTLASSVSSLSVALQPVREEMTFTLHGTTYVARNVVYCNYRTDINDGDIIEIDSQKYLILSVGNDGGRDHHLRMYVIKD